MAATIHQGDSGVNDDDKARLIRPCVDRDRKSQEQLRDEMAHVNRLNSMAEMATGIAHELNQPIAAISNYASACEQLLNSLGGDEQASRLVTQYVSAIQDLALQAGKVIQDLSEYSQKCPSGPQTIDLGEIVDSTLRMLAFDIRRGRVSIHWHRPEHQMPIPANPIQIRQVLVNLMTNAIEAMRDTDPSQRKLTIAVRTDDGFSFVRVSDRGCGLQHINVDQIFDPFVTTKPTGTGIGLAISKRIVESHGGNLMATSNVEGGAAFEFSLPLHADTKA